MLIGEPSTCNAVVMRQMRSAQLNWAHGCGRNEKRMPRPEVERRCCRSSTRRWPGRRAALRWRRAAGSRAARRWVPRRRRSSRKLITGANSPTTKPCLALHRRGALPQGRGWRRISGAGDARRASTPLPRPRLCCDSYSKARKRQVGQPLGVAEVAAIGVDVIVDPVVVMRQDAHHLRLEVEVADRLVDQRLELGLLVLQAHRIAPLVLWKARDDHITRRRRWRTSGCRRRGSRPSGRAPRRASASPAGGPPRRPARPRRPTASGCTFWMVRPMPSSQAARSPCAGLLVSGADRQADGRLDHAAEEALAACASSRAACCMCSLCASWIASGLLLDDPSRRVQYAISASY